jgi:glycerophosphoryl diester phosphodiesterase
VNLRRDGGRPLVIGHRGASAVAVENSLEALAAAVAAGADLVEFDVSAGLVVSHDAHASGPPLDAVLALLAPHGVGLHVDVKVSGVEQGVLDAVDRYGLRSRTLVSTAHASIARRVRTLAPELPVAIGYPRDSLGVSRLPWPAVLTRTGAAALRSAMPLRIPTLLGAARANVLALHHSLCSPAAVRTAHRRGAPILVWTVDDPAELRRFAGMGVDGIVSNDPARAVATLTAP